MILRSLTLDWTQAEKDLVNFKSWFQSNKRFNEKKVVDELKKYDHLCLLIAYLGDIRAPGVYKHEFEIQGVFRADYVVGDIKKKKFLWVEFEGGEENSIFGPKKTNQMREWGAQLQHGFSQISDWTWAKNDNQQSKVLQSNFGCTEMSEEFVLICGRSDSLDSTELSRLEWRRKTTAIAGARVQFLIYDDLIDHFDAQMDVYRAALAAAQRSKTS
jgi:hypothetical protein